MCRTSDSGRTPLHLACLANSAATVEALLQGGADVNATDDNGFSAQDMASGPAVLQALSKAPIYLFIFNAHEIMFESTFFYFFQ